MNTINTPIELRTSHDADRIALRGVRLTASVAGLSLKAVLEQTFVNQESHALEAIYTFPLPETAAVSRFEVRTGDHVLTGKVEQADEALKQYDNAISDGHGAYLLEQDRPDVFTARVGNLKPSQAATIAVGYVAPVERVDRSIRIRIPTTIAPRYVSAAGTDDPLETAMDGDALNPPHVLHVPYGVTMEVQVRLGPEVRAISSPTHAMQVAAPIAHDEPWRVSFAGGLVDMDRDIVLEIALASEVQPSVQIAGGPDDARYLALSFVPEFDEAALAEHRESELVFLLDCSGSMQGDSIRQATAALELCLRSLSSGDTFNICRFGSKFDFLSSAPLAYSAATLDAALRFIRKHADLGGTEIYAPLEKILEAPPAGGVRNVIVLTDGQVSNEPAVLALAQKWHSTNRLFTFGIGSAASGYLVRGLARVSGGAAEFISGNERIEEKVLRCFSRIGSPLVSDVAVRWGDADLQTPAEIPPVFDGDILRVFARAPGRLPETVTLECVTPAGPQRWSVPVPTKALDDDGVIATAWARAMIQSLEDSDDQATTVRRRRESTTVRRLINLSKQFNILCSQTAFFAVEHRTLEERNAGMPELQRIPVQLAHGWGELQDSDDFLAAPAEEASLTRGSVARLRKLTTGSLFGFNKHACAPAAAGFTTDFDSEGGSLDSLCESGETTHAELFQLLALQSAEGWFAVEYRQVLSAAGRDLGALDLQVANVVGNLLPVEEPLRTQWLSTLTVLVALHRWFADRKALWRRAQAKARRWLVSHHSVNDTQLEQMIAVGDPGAL